jgi:xylulose-5-phosphate/fructose-6-phosphate phosphoketolase
VLNYLSMDEAVLQCTRGLGIWEWASSDEGTTTTPFGMVMLNDLDRFHLVMDVIDRVPQLGSRAAHLRQCMVDERLTARQYTRADGDDAPQVRDWVWPY